MAEKEHQLRARTMLAEIEESLGIMDYLDVDDREFLGVLLVVCARNEGLKDQIDGIIASVGPEVSVFRWWSQLAEEEAR